jgi:hypothetical protein
MARVSHQGRGIKPWQVQPALPMHDGLMCPVSKRDLAMKVMQAVAMDVLGVVLPVEAKIY